MEPDEYARVARLERHHAWYVALRELVTQVLPSSRVRVLDIGCGTGGMLSRCGPAATGIDLSTDALGFASGEHRGRLARAEAEHLPFASGAFDVAIALDLLYHEAVQSEEAALTECARVLRPDGTLIVQVPAFAALRNRHDAVVHGARRYRKADLTELLRQAGFTVRFASYRVAPLVPVLALLRIAAKLGLSGGSNLGDLPPGLNDAMLAWLRAENALLTHRIRIPVGSSLFTVATRN